MARSMQRSMRHGSRSIQKSERNKKVIVSRSPETASSAIY